MVGSVGGVGAGLDVEAGVAFGSESVGAAECGGSGLGGDDSVSVRGAGFGFGEGVEIGSVQSVPCGEAGGEGGEGCGAKGGGEGDGLWGGLGLCGEDGHAQKDPGEENVMDGQGGHWAMVGRKVADGEGGCGDLRLAKLGWGR